MDRSELRVRLALFGLLALVVGAFWPAFSAGFLYFDDTAHVVANRLVTGGVSWEALGSAFQPHASLWTPLTWISHMLVVQFAGLNPFWHHLVNVVLHAGSVLLLFCWILRIGKQFWVALAVAALFAIHPLNVENVVWVAERNHLLAMIFLLAGLNTYTSYVAQVRERTVGKADGWLRLTELAMLASIMSKGVFCSFPVLLLILDAWPFRRFAKERAWKLVAEKWVLWVIAIFSVVMTMASLGREASSGDRLSLVFRVCVALTTLGWQAFRLFVPYELSPIHPMPKEILWMPAILSAAILALASYIGWRLRKRWPWMLAGLAWYLIALAPVSGITQAGNTFFSDRFAYLPQIGVFLALALSGADLLSKKRSGSVVGAGILIALVATYGAISFSYARLWKDTATLFTHAAAVTEGNFIAHTTAALALVKKNDHAGAVQHFEAGLRINPGAENFRNAYGDTLVALGRSPNAVEQYERVLVTEPANPTARYKLAITQLRLGRSKDALSHLQILKERGVKAPNLEQLIKAAESEASRETTPQAAP